MTEPAGGEMTAAIGQSSSRVGTEDVLSCGRPVAALVDQTDAGLLEPADEHQAGCVACRGALRDAATSSRALDLLRVERPAVPSGLVERVLHQVRLTRAPTSPLDLSGGGLLQLSGRVRVHRHVLAELARAAATAAGGPGVTVARSSASPAGTGGLRVALGLLVDGRTPLPVLAVAIRRAVRTALQHATNLDDVQVELTAVDLVAEPPAAGPGPGSGPGSGSGSGPGSGPGPGPGPGSGPGPGAGTVSPAA